ncbi:hypothetical protein [Eubacterium sp. MSJ-33]|nr:hypothetical protein [Eubacterium sp. MSJ-33]
MRTLKITLDAQVCEIQFRRLSSFRRIQFRAELRTEGWNED